MVGQVGLARFCYRHPRRHIAAEATLPQPRRDQL
jgi:hypothetical protein